jgi:hypothetical protein
VSATKDDQDDQLVEIVKLRGREKRFADLVSGVQTPLYLGLNGIVYREPSEGFVADELMRFAQGYDELGATADAARMRQLLARLGTTKLEAFAPLMQASLGSAAPLTVTGAAPVVSPEVAKVRRFEVLLAHALDSHLHAVPYVYKRIEDAVPVDFAATGTKWFLGRELAVLERKYLEVRADADAARIHDLNARLQKLADADESIVKELKSSD